MSKVVKKDLVERVYKECMLSDYKNITFSRKNLEIIFDTFISVLSEEILSDSTIELRGFGTFSKKDYSRTEFINPKTLEKVEKKNLFKIIFKPSSRFFK